MRARGQAEESQIERRSRLAADALDALSGRQIATTETLPWSSLAPSPRVFSQRQQLSTVPDIGVRRLQPKKSPKKTQLPLLLLPLLLRRESPQQSRPRPATSTLRPPPGARNGSRCIRRRPAAPAAALSSSTQQRCTINRHDSDANQQSSSGGLVAAYDCPLSLQHLRLDAANRDALFESPTRFRLPSWRNRPTGFCLHAALGWYRGFCMTRKLVRRG